MYGEKMMVKPVLFNCTVLFPVKVVFLVANTKTSEDQARLEGEHEEAEDIVQCGVEVRLPIPIHCTSLSYIS